MINNYELGKISIDGKEFSHDVIITKNEIIKWWRKESHNVNISDVGEVVGRKPKLIIIGTGHSGVMQVPQETVDFIRDNGIELIVQQTTEAVETFNDSKEENKIGMFHLTC